MNLNMSGKKYGTVLTIIIIVVITITVFLIGKLIYDLLDRKRINDAAADIIAEFDRQIDEAERSSNNNINGINATMVKTDLNNFTYGGYNMMGYIEIPSIKIKYPVLEKVTAGSLEIAVAILEGVGLNKVGNTVILGHNYRNGLFFSDLKKVKINDLVYITDRSGTRIKYKVYNVFSTTPEDSSFYDIDTEGKRQITLETCSDTGKLRTVVLAREAEEEEQKTQTNNTITNNVENNETTNNITENNNENTSGNLTNNPDGQITINRTEIKR